MNVFLIFLGWNKHENDTAFGRQRHPVLPLDVKVVLETGGLERSTDDCSLYFDSCDQSSIHSGKTKSVNHAHIMGASGPSATRSEDGSILLHRDKGFQGKRSLTYE